MSRDLLDRTYAVLMAGGSGTRFWPLSRRRRPKQLLPLTGSGPLVRDVLDRLAGLIPPERFLVVTGADQVEGLRAALPEVPEAGFLVEPAPRNTAPCLGLAAAEARRRDPDAICLCLPADHVIRPAQAFRECALRALGRADEAGTLLTFGVRPTRNATGYGYLETGAETAPGVSRVARFVEKPPAEKAAEYLARGNYFWNAGLFAWRADAFLAEVARHLPELAAGLEEIEGDPTLLEETFPRLPSVSVDYGVMEKTDLAEVVPADFEWDDVGSLAALARLLPPDAAGNHIRGDHVAVGCRDLVVAADGDHVIATLGIEGLIVVTSGNVTLIVPRDRAEEVRDLVRTLEERGREDLL